PEIVRATNLVLHRPLPTEVDIDPYLTEAVAAGRRVFVPRVDGERLALARITAETSWRRSKLGVLEPLSGEPLARELLERAETVIVVPGLAFSPAGERLGRGGGHYDRLLAEIRAAGKVSAIGVAFELQLVAAVASLEHDARVDRIVTETRVIG
ncbi:MAG: 5-formyltetrahydrofolate cyclo-ligase, partial [Candidatus Binatia bacterium]